MEAWLSVKYGSPRFRPNKFGLSLAWLVAMLVALLLPGAANAQTSTFYLDRIQVAGAPDDGMAIWRPRMHEETRLYGQFALGFGLNPFRVENHIADPRDAALISSQSGAPVREQFNLYTHIGIEFLERFAIQGSLPVVLVQTGNDTTVPGAGTDAVNLDPVALMDVRLDGRAVLFRSDDKAFQLGAIARMWLPSGNEQSWAGDRTTSGALGAAVEYDFDGFIMAFDTGVHFRPVGVVNDFTVQNEWTWGLGAFLPLRDDAVRLGAQVFGSTGISEGTVFTADNTPLEWMLEARFATDDDRQGFVGLSGGTRLTPGYAPDFRVMAAAGYWFTVSDTDPPSPDKKYKRDVWREGLDTDKDGLPDDVDLCPTDPEDGKPPNTDDGCPALPDRDGDGIPDSSDKCPDTPEDFDKIDDWDGCPEDDADEDGIGDAEDACPKEPGDKSEIAEKNGCPQFIRRITGSSEIEILKQVEFATGSARILPSSYPILDEVYRLLNVNKEITLLSIEGHTDDRGSDELNQKLSGERAQSCMEYLVKKGIDNARLRSEGFGEKRPVADNETAAESSSTSAISPSKRTEAVE